MDKMVYTSTHGAKQIMLQQVANNHNLANLNTTGFRADLDSFINLPVNGPGHASRIYSQDTRVGIDFSYGQLFQTGRDLDIAINGDGFIAVQSPTGVEGYTRAGDLRVSSAGQLETGAGYKVIGNGGPIAIPPFQKIEVGADGTISIQPLGQELSNLAILDRIKLVKPELSNLVKQESGLLVSVDATPSIPSSDVKITSGSLESSNVNAVDVLINMISLARSFEAQVKMMKVAETNDEATAKLLNIS